jgi:hypothetical protein
MGQERAAQRQDGMSDDPLLLLAQRAELKAGEKR